MERPEDSHTASGNTKWYSVSGKVQQLIKIKYKYPMTQQIES